MIYIPKAQDIYRHFKGNLYQIITIATNSETREEMVVYQAVYGEHEIWVRPAKMWNDIIDLGDKKVARFTPIE